MEKIHNIFLNNEKVTKKQLKAYGYTSSEISDFIDDKILVRVGFRYYKLSDKTKGDIEEKGKYLYNKGMYFFDEENFAEAKIYLEKSSEYLPKSISLNMALLDIDIFYKNYDEALNRIEQLYTIATDEKDIKDLSFYLYLLGGLVNLTECQRDKIKQQNIYDWIISGNDSSYSDCNLINKVRIAASSKRFFTALQLIKEELVEEDRFVLDCRITKKLLFALNLKQRKINADILELINKKSYVKLINLLELEKERMPLTMIERSVLSIAKDLIDIELTGNIPAVGESLDLSVENLLKVKDFDKALVSAKAFLERNNFKAERNALVLILTDINAIINSVKNNNKKSINNRELAGNEQIILTGIVHNLIKKDLDVSCKMLHQYLASVKKEKYEFLIVDLIELSMIKKEGDFLKSIEEIIGTIASISKGNFEFDLEKYVKDFYCSIATKNHNEAKIYLDIITKAKSLGYVFEAKDALDELLESAITLDEKTKYNDTALEETKQVTNKNTSGSLEDRLTKMIEEKRDYLKQGNGIVILKPKHSRNHDKICSIVETMPDVRAFSIGVGSDARIVLRYTPKFNGSFINIGKETALANKKYREGKYEESIVHLKKLISVGNPPSYIYGLMGWSLIKTSNLSLGLEYLTVANELLKKQGSNLDYTDIIDKMSGRKEKPDDEERKPNVSVKLSEFEDTKNNFGIETLDEIRELVITCGEKIGEVCAAYGLNTEQENIVKVLLARDYYKDDKYATGDEILKQVEKSTEKTPLVKSLYSETITNKRFYRNRKNK